MKTALLLILAPALALGRVGEKLEDFKRRVEDPPIDETRADSITMSIFKVHGVPVEVYSIAGVIRMEVYKGVEFDSAKLIMSKQPGKFAFAESSDMQHWSDPVSGIYGRREIIPKQSTSDLIVGFKKGADLRSEFRRMKREPKHEAGSKF